MARGRARIEAQLAPRRKASVVARPSSPWALVQPWATVGDAHPGRCRPAGARIFVDEDAHAAAMDAWAAGLPDPPPPVYEIPDGPSYWAPVPAQAADALRARGEAAVATAPPRPVDAGRGRLRRP